MDGEIESLTDSSVSSDEESVGVVYTVEDIFHTGLRVFYSRKRIRRAKRPANIERFVAHYGVLPQIIAEIIQDLQLQSMLGDDCVAGNNIKLKWILMSFHFLKCYPTELEREGPWDIDSPRARTIQWYYLEKIQLLKTAKIKWPTDWGKDIWIITVDGIHCWVSEPQHPEWSQDSDYFSHKYGKAGVMYELGIAIAESKLVWMNGPFKAGYSDLKVFKNKGLKAKLESIKRQAIADSGYPGFPKLASTPNNEDSKGVKRFKSRALKQHEYFNNLIKNFDCLDVRFRHSLQRHRTCFEAVAVICQYQVEYDKPLYDVLIEGLDEE
jgi:hypothetical protein